MKTVVIGDIHGKRIWKDIIEKENPDRTVFIGDYFDSYTVDPLTQLDNFKDIIEFKKHNDVILLIGNHDFHYFPEIGNVGTSGFQPHLFHSFSQTIDENRDLLQMCYCQDKFLFSHAGISVSWLKNVFKKEWTPSTIPDLINNLFIYKPKYFSFAGLDPYGDDPQQSPIWIRPKSLKRTNNNTNVYRKYVQVVGHTRMRKIEYSGRCYFVDTLDFSGEYMVIVDGIEQINKFN